MEDIYLEQIKKCDLLDDEKEEILKRVDDYDVEDYIDGSVGCEITYFDKDGNSILVLDVNSETDIIDVLEYEKFIKE